MNLETFELVVKTVPGIATTRHARALYGLVRWLQPKVVVETGSWKGFTACWIARALEDLSNEESYLHCIDNFSLGTAGSDLHNSLAACQLANKVMIVDGDSKDPANWPNQVDMAYVDGDHSLEGCQTDLRLAIERGAQCLVIHDTVSWWGPRLALDWLRSEGWNVIECHFDEGLAIAMPNRTKPPESYTQAEYPKGHV